MLLAGRPQIHFFLNDYQNALKTANTLNSKVQNDGLATSSNYADLVALAIKQALGTMDTTITKGSDNKWDTTDLKMFMKNTASVGGGGYVHNLLSMISTSHHRISGHGKSALILLTSFMLLFLCSYMSTELGGQLLLTPLLEYRDPSLHARY